MVGYNVGAPFRLDKDHFNCELIHADVSEGLEHKAGQKFRLIISSPPYNIGKSYEKDAKRTIEDYTRWQEDIAEKLVQSLEDDGSLCWQVGSFVNGDTIVPLDFIFYNIFTKLGLKLRNRIIWRFNFGRNADKRFSGRYETLLWFSKSDSYVFNLDPVRVPQIYPGKRHSLSKQSEKAGLPSGNPLGKNPSDYWEFSAEKDFRENPIWDIPNVKANHVEKTIHPCQFPIELAERCILAFTNVGDSVLDPFVGTGASVIAALKCNRMSVGIDKEKNYIDVAQERITALRRGDLRMRPIGKPVERPNPNRRVTRMPAEWIAKARPEGAV
jgi:DNA modification methylase